MGKFRKGLLIPCVLFILCVAIFTVSFFLYHLPPQAVLYPAGLCAGLLLAYAVISFVRARRKHRTLCRLRSLPENLCAVLEEYGGQDDEDYRAIIRLLCERSAKRLAQDEAKMTDMMDYYTTWVHQIKTPIASMRLTLQDEDTPTARHLSEDLFRIEQYVEMVLCYLRLDSDSTDYVFRECSLDELIKAALRKYAGQFIGKGIRLCFSGTDVKVVTDEKWLSFVVEQILSNALKYTPSGSISMTVEPEGVLCITDTGIGISPEDLPRVFEKGYTGFNGRKDSHSSGLGLYLCRRICDNLGHKITISSTLGKGTAVRILLSRPPMKFE